MAKQNKQEFAQEFADKIIKAIEAGTAPWMKPWDPGQTGLAKNFKTGKPYKGMNCVFLTLSRDADGFTSNLWGDVQADIRGRRQG